jgi:hypothetical protein
MFLLQVGDDSAGHGDGTQMTHDHIALSRYPVEKVPHLRESRCCHGVGVDDLEDCELFQLEVIFVVAVVMIRVRRQVGADLAPYVYLNCGHECQ